jgi:PAS domain S-box-containing protein
VRRRGARLRDEEADPHPDRPGPAVRRASVPDRAVPAMKTDLNILIVEDSGDDAVLVARELERAGYSVSQTRVEDAAGLAAALRQPGWDAVICDYTLPRFNALEALKIVRDGNLDLPFVIVSGSIGEDVAVEALKAGAHDYLLKQNLRRLGPAVRRAIEDASLRAEHRRAADSLRETNETLRALIQGSPLAIVSIDAQHRVTMWNRAAERMFGWQEQEVVGRPIPIVPEAKDPEFGEVFGQAMQGIGTSGLETTRRRRDGTIIDVVLSTAPLHDGAGRAVGAMGIFADITERKMAEEALRRSEQRYRDLVESARDVILTISPDGIITSLNSVFETLTGWPRAAWVGKGFVPLLHPDDVPAGLERFQSVLGGTTPPPFEIRVRRQAGGHLTVELTATPQVHAGRVAGVLGVARDVTERKKAEEALRESEERFRQLTGTIKEVFWMTNPVKNEMIYISPAYEDIWGRSCQSLFENPLSWADAIHPEDRDGVLQAALSRQASGQYDEEYRVVRPDGSVRWIRDRAYPVRNAAGEVYRIAGIAEDITEGKQLSEQLRQSQKMEAVGQLAGGVAHDFNNLLTIIMGYSDILLRQTLHDEKQRREISGIRTAAERAARLTRQLLAFSRQQVLQAKALDLNDIVGDMEKMLRRLIGEDIELVTVCAPALKRIKADPGQLEQVLMNLVVNARDAMPDGGTLILETQNVDLDEAFCRQHPGARPGAYVMLAVSDTGRGMSQEVKQRIFEPFFTTKEKGKGTGLGLSTVYGIVKQSEGYISAYSEEGKGTTFKVYLPRLDASAEDAALAAAPAGPPCGTETVLLVEDDEVVRELVGNMLQNLGYTVLTAANGEEAVAVCKTHEGVIHLALTDVVMPVMGGPDATERMLAIRPGIKLLFMSGYTDHAALRRGVLKEGTPFLQKPFTSDSLARKIREVLDSEGKGALLEK